MKSKVEIELKEPDLLREVLEGSLQGNKKVNYKLETRKNKLEVNTTTETLPQLRGCTDTVFRLSSLAQKIFKKY